jgi:hypothetical protein
MQYSESPPFKERSLNISNAVKDKILREHSPIESRLSLVADDKENARDSFDKMVEKEANSSKISFYNALENKTRGRSSPPCISDPQAQRDCFYWGVQKPHLAPKNSKVIRRALKMRHLQTSCFQSMFCGPESLALLDAKEDLYMLGKQLNTTWMEPTKVMSNVVHVSLAKDLCLAVTKKGELWACGNNT